MVGILLPLCLVFQSSLLGHKRLVLYALDLIHQTLAHFQYPDLVEII